jgi:tetratricopeptide (TPR) repeat protein
MATSRVLRGALLALAVVALALVLLWRAGGDRIHARIVDFLLTRSVEQKIAALNVGSRTVALPSEKGREVRAAIINRDFARANKISDEMLLASHLSSWQFYPFTDFIENAVDPDNPDDPNFEAGLSAWVAHDTGAAMPLLVRARYYLELARAKRGEGYSSEVSRANMDAFATYSGKAFSDIQAAIQLDARNPYEFYLRLNILHGFGASKEMLTAFEDAVGRYPGYYGLYDVMLETLQPKWGGSVPAMYALVDKYAGSLDASSPLKLLHVTLYRCILETATSTCWSAQPQDAGKRDACVSSAMQSTVTPGLRDSMLIAFQEYGEANRYQFSVALADILSGAIRNSGGDYANELLQIAATSLHSNTQLIEQYPGRNNYVIDEAVAKSWYQNGFYENAARKAEEALRDIGNTRFPGEAEKDVAVGGVLDALARANDALGHTQDVIAEYEAATRIGDATGVEKYVCYIFYKSADYGEAVRTCSHAIERGDFAMEAHYWRAAAYRDSGDTEAALKDLAIVAGSRNRFRSDAAIDMSMIYFGRKDNHGALDVLNRYQYLYDLGQSQRETLAVSYNNRCYAYMELGELQKALDDCNQSLKYGSIPDAYSKQAELLKRLSVPHPQS